jgi:hypothetical protein
MTRFLGAVIAAVCVTSLATARADETEAKAVVDKAVKAAGGEEKLAKVGAYTFKSKASITFNGNESEFDGKVTIQGLDHYRNEFGNDQFQGVIVLSGDKGWRKFGDNAGGIDGKGLAREKRMVYLSATSVLLVPLKGKGFKLATAADEKVGDKPAAVVKVTGPDGQGFSLLFDKETGLPVKQVAKVTGFNGEEFTQETTYADYKDFDGIKKATKVESKRDGETFMKMTISEFKVLDKVDAGTFNEPK